MRTTWYEDEDYHMTYELIDNMVFVHVTFDRFSKKVLSDLKEKWLGFKLKLYSLGYEYVFTYTKDTRIVNLIGGGQQIGRWNNYKVIAWDLN